MTKQNPFKEVECKRCGNKWLTKIDPKQCPQCKQYNWRSASKNQDD